ncbi:MAG: DUF554 family protein [Clostridia bacterium]|nr:DUF554 family protein [Clostridia bacterium]
MNTILEFLKPLWSFFSQAVLSAFPVLNTAIVIGAGFLGMRLHGRFRTSIRDIIIRALGIAVVLFSISELWNSFFVLQEGMIETEGTLLAFISLPVGWLIGEALSIDRGLGKLGLFLHSVFEKPDTSVQAKKTQLSPEETARLVLTREERATGFIIATTLCCFSSLIFTRFLEGRINGDPLTMVIKLAFDFVLVFWLAAIYGSGVPFAGISVLISEGILGISYTLWGDFFTPKLIGQLSLVGGMILLFGGISLCRGKRFRAANLIPALFIPILYTSVMERVDEITEESKSKK